jgi:Holliday junction resolvasome RuvABC endonuclease subunit
MEEDSKYLIVGVDYSLNSPALSYTIIDDLSKRFRANMIKGISICPKYNSKNFESEVKNWSLVPYPEYTDLLFRYNRLVQLISTELDPLMDFTNFSNRYVAVEDYSFGSKGRAVLQIAENASVFKNYLYHKNFNIRLLEPTTIKKFATDHGLAKKEMMWDATEEKFPWFTKRIAEFKVGDSPSSDMVDSLWILYMMWVELKIRNDNLDHLSKEEINFFHKSFPKKDPLTSRNFISLFSKKNGENIL